VSNKLSIAPAHMVVLVAMEEVMILATNMPNLEDYALNLPTHTPPRMALARAALAPQALTAKSLATFTFPQVIRD